MNAEQDLLSAAALTVFELNGQFLRLADDLSAPAGLTAARWQVLGAVLGEPLPVAEIARRMGLTRQSVQRTADRLVADGLARFEPNPAHKRAKLVSPTEEGFAAVGRIEPTHAAYASRLAAELGVERFAGIVDALDQLRKALSATT